MRRLKLPAAIASVLVVALTASPVMPSATAGAEPVIPPGFADHKVTAGAYDPVFGDSPQSRFEYQAFYPSSLQLHRGDVVWFEEQGTHSVTFFPGGVHAEAALLLRDEVPGDVAIHAGSPSDLDCAMFDDLNRPPCQLTSADQYLSSGVNFLGKGGMRVEVDLPEGSYPYFCKIHPNMTGEIEVVPETTPVPTPEQVEAERVAQVAADTAAGQAVIDEFDGPEYEVLPDGRLRWEVIAGGTTDDGRVSLERFLPDRLTIAPGDEVEFVAGPMHGGAHEFHTATFIARDVAMNVGFGSYMHFSCDPDDPHTGLPGVRASAVPVFTGCPSGTTSELVLYPWAYHQPLKSPGGSVLGDLPIHDSGLLAYDDGTCIGRCDPWTGEELPERSDATFPVEGSYELYCLIHALPGMTASIEVAGV